MTADNIHSLKKALVPERTYFHSTLFWTPPATPTDVWNLGGSATTAVKIWQIKLSAFQTTGGMSKWFLLKRTVLPTGGTPATAILPGLFDNLDAAATAIINAGYTSNPTITGTALTITTATPYAALAAGTSLLKEADAIIFDARKMGCKPIVLRSAAENVALNFNGAALPTGLSIAVSCLFSESSITGP